MPELRPLTGMDEDVYKYVMKWKETNTFYEKLLDLLLFMIPGYKKKANRNSLSQLGVRVVSIAQSH